MYLCNIVVVQETETMLPPGLPFLTVLCSKFAMMLGKLIGGHLWLDV